MPACGKLKHYYEQGGIVKDAIKRIRIEDGGVDSRDESSDMSESEDLSGVEATV
jgi:hypothetical protein